MTSGVLSRLSDDVRVMFRPMHTFAELARLPAPSSDWLRWRRPAFVVLVVCICISMLTSGRLTLHLVGSTAIYWSFLPLVQIAGLSAVLRAWPAPDVVDRFFAGNGPWLLWLIAFTAFAAGDARAAGTPTALTLMEVAAAAGLLWCLWIDYRFFGSIRKLALHRAVSWTLFVAIFAGSWIWNEIAWRLGL